MIVIGVRFLCNIISISFFCVYNDIHVCMYVFWFVSVLYCIVVHLHCIVFVLYSVMFLCYGLLEE